MRHHVSVLVTELNFTGRKPLEQNLFEWGSNGEVRLPRKSNFRGKNNIAFQLRVFEEEEEGCVGFFMLELNQHFQFLLLWAHF